MSRLEVAMDVRFPDARDKGAVRKLRPRGREYFMKLYGQDHETNREGRTAAKTLTAWNGRTLLGIADVHQHDGSSLSEARFKLHSVEFVVGTADKTSIAVVDHPLLDPDHDRADVVPALMLAAGRYALASGIRYLFTKISPSALDVHVGIGFEQCGQVVKARRRGQLDSVPMYLDLGNVQRLMKVSSSLLSAAEAVYGKAELVEDEDEDDEPTPPSAMAIVDPALAARAQQRAAPASPKPAPKPPPSRRHTQVSPARRPAPRTPPPSQGPPDPPALEGRAIWERIFALRKDRTTAGSAFLNHIGREELDALIRGGRVLALPRGDQLVRAGERRRDVYLLLNGQLELVRGDRPFGLLRAGDVVGEMAFLRQTDHNTAVRARTASQVLQLPAEHLDQVVVRPGSLGTHVAMGLAASLSRKLTRMNRRGERPPGR
jgi:hypothetical protein